MLTDQKKIYLPDIIGGGYGAFWRSTKRYRVVKGSRRSKKSTTQALWLIYNIMRWPLANALVVRKVAATLKDSCFAQLKWAARQLGVYEQWEFKLSPLEAIYRRSKGAPAQHIYFRGLDDPFKITSITVEHGCLCWIWLEEAFELDSEAEFDTLNESIMGDLPPGYFRQTTLTFNPWSSSSWIKARFFDREDPDVLAMTTTYKCNEWLSEDDRRYFDELQRTNPTRYKVAGLGDWGVEGETFFEEWRDDPEHYIDRVGTHVIEPFEVPEDWRIYRGFDFGYAKPFSVGWWACDHDGRLYRILELYGCTNEPNTGVKWAPDQIFGEVKRIETEHRWLKGRRVTGVADPSIWDASRGVSVAETAARQGVYFEPGDNKRIPGWMQVHYRLRFDENGIPMMYVFKNCKAFIRTMPLLVYDDTKPEDLDTDMEDHIADETRYICMARPINPPKAPPKQAPQYDPLSTDDRPTSNRYAWYITH